MTSLTNPLPEHIRSTIDEVCAANGVTSIDVQIRGQRDQLILDLFIDAPNGVTHDECKGVTAGLDERLENDEWYGRLRAVDVSSPGADAPVKFLWQLSKSLGRTVRVIRADGTEVEGKLTDVADEGLVVQPPTTKKKIVEQVTIPASDVKEARVILKW
ncbi:ribosome maturation factor RimP [soil metagenome]